MARMLERPGTELELVDQFLAHIASLCPDASSLQREVRSHGRAQMDICYSNGANLIAVEAKLRDWRRALAQAYLNRYCVDRTYILLWNTSLDPAIRHEAIQYDVGVFLMNHDGLTEPVRAPLRAPHAQLRGDLLTRLTSEEG